MMLMEVAIWYYDLTGRNTGEVFCWLHNVGIEKRNKILRIIKYKHSYNIKAEIISKKILHIATKGDIL